MVDVVTFFATSATTWYDYFYFAGDVLQVNSNIQPSWTKKNLLK